MASTRTHHKILYVVRTDRIRTAPLINSREYLKRGLRSAREFRGITSLSRELWSVPSPAYPTTGTCRFRNSSGASAIGAMNSNVTESPATGWLNGRGEPTGLPRNSFNQPRNSCSIRWRSFTSGRYALRHRVFLNARSQHLLSYICI